MSVNQIKEIQKKIQEKEYQEGYLLCQDILNSSSSSSSSENKILLNVLLLSSSCSLQLLNYLEAEKTFKSALLLDTNGQFTQKIWKVRNHSLFSHKKQFLFSISLHTKQQQRVFLIFMKNLKIGKIMQKHPFNYIL